MIRVKTGDAVRISLMAAAAALALTACNGVGHDRSGPGADHEAYVIVNPPVSYPGVKMLEELEGRAMAGATQRCQTEGRPVVEVLRKDRTNINTMILTYRCKAS